MNLVLEKIRVSAGVFSLEVDTVLEGRAIGLFGDSGAGKTTLVELLAGLRELETGRITLDTQVLADASLGLHVAPERRGIGYVPQDGALFPHMNVRQNLLYGHRRAAPADTAPLAPPVVATGGATGRKIPFSPEDTAKAMDVEHLLDRRVAGLSGGERQRVALARALLASPRLLLLDEPLNSLDARHKEAILPSLRRIRDDFGVPLIYVSHAPDELMALCDHLVVLSRGRVVTRGAAQEVLRNSR